MPRRATSFRSKTRPGALSLLALVAVLTLTTAAGSGDRAALPSRGDPEYRVKALFLYKMAHWLQWPKTNLPESAKEIVIGVVGKDPFGKELEVIDKLKPIGGRQVKTRRFDDIGSIKDCQIVFISAALSESDESKVLAQAARDGFVTVSERDKFCDRGGMFNLLIVNSKLTFEANPGAAKGADVKISSQLLKLAHRIVKKD